MNELRCFNTLRPHRFNVILSYFCTTSERVDRCEFKYLSMIKKDENRRIGK
jgi:hypothetical protein